MKISWNWLTQLINLKQITEFELAEKLTLAGFEIENITHIKDLKDTTLDISINANRIDMISLASIVVEVSAMLKVQSKLKDNIKEYSNKIKYIKLESSDDFDMYTKLRLSIIENLSVGYSPKWIQNYLIASDIHPTNSILDIISLINFKWGQSIKIFEIKNNKINTQLNCKTNRSINKKTNWKELNAQIIELNSKNISNYQYTNISILIKGNISNTNSIHNKKQRKEILSKQYLFYAYTEAIDLIQQIYKKNIKDDIIYEYKNLEINTKIIKCNIKSINQTLGPIKCKGRIQYLDKTTIIDILQRLEFTVVNTLNELEIKVPEERSLDIQKEIDIVEEVSRIYGFNHFCDDLRMSNKIGKISSKKLTTQKIRKILRSIGLHEVLSYSLGSNIHKNNIQLINPLNQDQKQLRTNLIDNLIESILHNNNKANEPFEVFEIGQVFTNNYEREDSNENLHLAGVLGSSSFYRSEWNKSSNELSWFQAKGNLEEFFERMHAQVSWSANSENNYLIHNTKKYLHPQRTSFLKYKNQTIGLFSQINSKLAKKIGILHKVYIFEININLLMATIQTPKHSNFIYKPYSNYPKIIRDLSIKINKEITQQRIRNIINKILQEHSNLIESINIFDEYYETRTIKKIGLRTTYRASNKTLTNEEVEKIEKRLQTKLDRELMQSKS